MELQLIIGLPGSGKTTLVENMQKESGNEYIIYDDWMEWTSNDKDKNCFDADLRYDEIIENINNNKKKIIISCIKFCEHKFLCSVEYHLQYQFPDIEIKRIYFENNIKSSILNIKYRDVKKGGYWKELENGKMLYCGIIFNDIPLYKLEIENATELSKEYIIPLKYKALPIMVQNIKELPK
tara:strand:- start:54 stop:596 length:543 start_codon:yes stop_codon:yes gene_type:complete